MSRSSPQRRQPRPLALCSCCILVGMDFFGGLKDSGFLQDLDYSTTLYKWLLGFFLVAVIYWMLLSREMFNHRVVPFLFFSFFPFCSPLCILCVVFVFLCFFNIIILLIKKK